MIRHSSATDAPDRVLTISRWHEVFETAKSRKLVHLQYLNTPIGCDSAGYIELVTCYEHVGLAALGVFQALCQLTATWGPGRRGRFLKTNGTPYTVAQIAALIRVRESILQECLDALLDEQVGWLKWEPATDLPTVCQPSATDLPTVSQPSATDLPPYRRREGEERREGRKERGRDAHAHAPALAEVEEEAGTKEADRIPRPGFPEKAAALDYAEAQGWPAKSALAWWLDRDTKASTGEPRFRDPNFHWWSDLERWVLNDARGGGMAGARAAPAGGVPAGGRTSAGKRTILDYESADTWTPDQISLTPTTPTK
jgi:hypothetical protein